MLHNLNVPHSNEFKAKQKTMSTFSKLGLLNTLLKTLAEKGYTKPTDIQLRTIPTLLEGRSVVGIAETGGGKTLAYGLPLLHLMKSMELNGLRADEPGRPRAAVIVPTRELGEQVSKVFKVFTHDTRVRVRVVLGGTAMDVARRNVSGAFEILVATPGRLVQLLDRKIVDLSDVHSLVFDEADQMLDQGFRPDAARIVSECPAERQLALFSATASPAVQELIRELFSEAELVESQGSHKVPDTLITENRTIKDGLRFPVLEKVLAKKVEGGTLIFTNTREQCDRLAEALKETKYRFAIYRGEMDKLERRANLRAFRDGKIDLLISTDLASRGLDVEHVERVINYHLPQEMENYIHRAGRTARAGRSGVVINFVTERDLPLVRQLDQIQGSKKAPARKGTKKN
jgi:superfamily II DNA/RNA helicase